MINLVVVHQELGCSVFDAFHLVDISFLHVSYLGHNSVESASPGVLKTTLLA